MRIVFLCSSLEPGRDGVGDYVRTLAASLELSGHECQLIALHDRWLDAIEERKAKSSPADADGASVASLRLPAQAPWPERMRQARICVARFKADWVSLHFVPYGYQDKGLVFGLGRRLASLTAACRLHIMFHELWIGGPGAPWKHRLVGSLQRALILRLLRQTRPACVTTSNAVYQGMIGKIGYEAPLLPIFGNVPIVQDPEQSWTLEALREAGAPEVSTNREGCWIFVFFGLLHPEWAPEPLFSQVRRAAARAGKTVVMLALGRLGSGEALWTRMARDYDDAFRFVSFGEQPARRVSEVLLAADVGIAASPWDLMGKSGSAACMFDHGLPIIVTRHGSPTVQGTGPVTRYFHCDDTLEDKLVRGLPRQAPASRLPEVAADLVRLLVMAARAPFPMTASAAAPPLLTRLLVALARHWPLRRGRSGLRRWVSQSLRGRPPLVRTRLAESKLSIAVPWQDTTGATVITYGDSEPDVFRLICSRLRERGEGQDLFVDVGANLGVFSLRVAERFPQCKVIAFEPNPEIAALLRDNACTLGMTIDLREMALGEADVDARLATVAGDSGLSSLRSGGSEGIPVRVRRLATELTVEEWKRIAVMKIDVEGYELGVFRGAEPLFAQHLPVLVFEVNRPELRAHGVEPRELGDFLRGVGYEKLLALDGVLYPPENGLHEVCNLVALPAEARAFAGQHGYDPHFAPQPESMWPTVQYPV